MSTPAPDLAGAWMVRVETTTRMPSDSDQAAPLIARLTDETGAVVSSSDRQLVQLVVSVAAAGHEEATRAATDLLIGAGVVPLVMESMPVSEWTRRDSSSFTGDLVPVKEAAKALGLSHNGMLARIRRGQVAARRVGDIYLVPADALRDAPKNLKNLETEAPNGYVTLDQAGKILGLTRKGVYQRIRAGSLPGLKIGHRYFTPTEGLTKPVTREAFVPPEGYVTITEATTRLDTSRSTVERQIRKGLLPAVKDGRRVMVPAEALVTFPPEGYLSVPQAADRLDVLPWVVYARIRRRTLPSVKVGQRIAVSEEAVRHAPRKYQRRARRKRQRRALPEDHVTTAVAGKMLGVTPQYVTQRIRTGSLPALTIGRRYFVPIEALDNVVPRGSITVQQAAARLGVTPEWVRQRIREGSLPAAKVGHRYFIRAEGLTRPTPVTRKAFVPPEGYVTTPEAARRLGISRKNVGNRIRKGFLPAVKDGRRLIVPVEALVTLPTEGHVSVYEAADRLGVTKWALYERIRSGILPSVKVGQTIAIPIAALDDQVGDLRHLRSGRKRNTTDPRDTP